MARKRERPDIIGAFYRHAADAKRFAEALRDSSERKDLLEIEQRWLALARSYEAHVERPPHPKLRRK